jgi:hypothetical protein
MIPGSDNAILRIRVMAIKTHMQRRINEGEVSSSGVRLLTREMNGKKAHAKATERSAG